MREPLLLAGDKRRKTCLFALIDDVSRLIVHAEFYLSEGLAIYLPALRQTLLKLGLSRKLCLDSGPAFRSHHLGKIPASLGIALVHSPPYVPQDSGKIERFFRTVRSQFLPGFKGDTLREINEALACWLWDGYHQRKHLAPDRPPCNVSPTKWNASGRPTPTWKTTSKKGPRAAWPWTTPSPWPAGYTRPQCP
ncbi:transposase [Desulfarculales bacterium]